MNKPDPFILYSGVVLGIMAYVFRTIEERCCDAMLSRQHGEKEKSALKLKDAINTIRRSVIGHRPLTEDEVKALELVLSEAEYRTPHFPIIISNVERCPECRSSLNFKNLKYYCPKCGKYFTPDGQ